jgi:DNA-binding response OmpR family regulator
MAAHILLTDDDELLRRSLAFNLEQAGYRVSTAATAEAALKLACLDPPDLVLLDIGLPKMDGLEALKRLRTEMEVPVILITARRRELDQVVGLELGGDDYITKPFNVDVVLARVKAVLRRFRHESRVPGRPDQHPLVVGDIEIDPLAHTVVVGGRTLSLPPREFDLLHALAADAGHVKSLDDLLAEVWGANFIGETQVVYVHIRWLREKLEEDPLHPRRIVNVRGVGYKLEPQGA